MYARLSQTSIPPTFITHNIHTSSLDIQPDNPVVKMSLTNCRFYEGKYPEVESFVMVRNHSCPQYEAEHKLTHIHQVNVKQIAEMGAYVKLLEYDNIDGMILLSELSRRRIRSIQKLIRVGRNEVVVVLRVDKEKGMLKHLQCSTHS